MSTHSSIEWTKSIWNPLNGYTKTSPGCRHCYAERMSRRLKAIGNANYRNGFELTLHEHVLDRPLHWKKPQMIFVNSMSDLLHREVTFFFKQWGGVCKKRNGRTLGGRTWDEMPAAALVR